MRFKDFLVEKDGEELPAQPFTRSITESSALQWAKMHAPEFMAQAAEHPTVSIYRGAPGKNFQLGDSSAFKRKSLNAKNYYTRFISTSPRWKDYPSREHAFVCANSSGIASGYGDNVFVVIPEDSAKIGICPKYDIWVSFPKIKSALGLQGLNSVQDFIMFACNFFEGHVIQDTNIEELRTVMKTWTYEKMVKLAKSKPIGASHRMAVEDATHAAEAMKKLASSNFCDLLEKILDPKQNEFVNTVGARVIGELSDRHSRELWIQGKCLFINEKIYDDFIGGYNA